MSNLQINTPREDRVKTVFFKPIFPNTPPTLVLVPPSTLLYIPRSPLKWRLFSQPLRNSEYFAPTRRNGDDRCLSLHHALLLRSYCEPLLERFSTNSFPFQLSKHDVQHNARRYFVAFPVTCTDIWTQRTRKDTDLRFSLLPPSLGFLSMPASQNVSVWRERTA